jgi:hypothetical protein
MDEQTEYLVDSIKKAVVLLDNHTDFIKKLANEGSPFDAEAWQYKLDHIDIPCRDVLDRAIYLLTTTATNYESASAVYVEVANILGIARIMTTFRHCNIKFCSCSVRELYRLIGTPDVLSQEQMEIEDRAHAANDAHVKAVKELENKKKNLSAAKYALHSFHWDISASNEDEMERITALVAASTKAKGEKEDCETLVYLTKAAFDGVQMRLYDMHRTTRD